MQVFNYTSLVKLPNSPHHLMITTPADPDKTSIPEIQTVQQYLDALERGDTAGAKALLVENVVLHVPGRSLLSGEYRGPDAVLEHEAKRKQLSDNTYKKVVAIWLVMVPHIHNVTLEHAERKGQPFDFNRSTVYELHDGKITDIQIHDEDQYAVDAFWS